MYRDLAYKYLLKNFYDLEQDDYFGFIPLGKPSRHYEGINLEEKNTNFNLKEVILNEFWQSESDYTEYDDVNSRWKRSMLDRALCLAVK